MLGTHVHRKFFIHMEDENAYQVNQEYGGGARLSPYQAKLMMRGHEEWFIFLRDDTVLERLMIRIYEATHDAVKQGSLRQ